jgi:hypothetical protein
VVGFGWLAGRELVVTDEGGVRCRNDGLCEYVPYPSIHAARVERTLQRRWLVLDTDQGQVISLLSGSIDAEPLRVAIQTSRDAARKTQELMMRDRGEVGAWVASLAVSKSIEAAGAMYRSQIVDEDLFEQTLADTTDAIEARAASAHLLLVRGRADRVARLISERSPPLVIAAVRLSPKGESIVSRDLLEDVLPFLSVRDRVVFGQRTRAAIARVA